MSYQERKYLTIGFLTALVCAILSWGIAISTLLYPLHHPIFNVTLEKTVFILMADSILFDSLHVMAQCNQKLYQKS